MRRLLILAMILLFHGCTMRPTPIPEPSSTAATLYREKCGICHAVPHPKRHTYEQWQHMMDVMERHARKGGMVLLTEEEKGVILEYLKRHSR